MKNKAVLFDLDGTLWDATQAVVISWNRVLSRHDNMPVMTLEKIQSYMGKTIDEITDLFFADIPHECGYEIALECCREEAIYLAKHGGVPYDKLAEMLEELSRKYMLGIISNCEDGYIEAFLGYHKLGKYFSDYEYSGRTTLPKGENIKMVIERNNIEKSVYVGDTSGDASAAAHAEVNFIYAAYGFGSVEKPQYSANSIVEAGDIAKKILG